MTLFPFCNPEDKVIQSLAKATVAIFLFPKCKWILLEVIEGNWWHYLQYLEYQQHINEMYSRRAALLLHGQHIWPQTVFCLSWLCTSVLHGKGADTVDMYFKNHRSLHFSFCFSVYLNVTLIVWLMTCFTFVCSDCCWMLIGKPEWLWPFN